MKLHVICRTSALIPHSNFNTFSLDGIPILRHTCGHEVPGHPDVFEEEGLAKLGVPPVIIHLANPRRTSQPAFINWFNMLEVALMSSLHLKVRFYAHEREAEPDLFILHRQLVNDLAHALMSADLREVQLKELLEAEGHPAARMLSIGRHKARTIQSGNRLIS